MEKSARERAFEDACSHYKVAFPGLMGALKTVGGGLGQMGRAGRQAFGHVPGGSPSLRAAGKAALGVGKDLLAQPGFAHAAKTVGGAGALVGGGALLGRATAPSQPQQPQYSPYPMMR